MTYKNSPLPENCPPDEAVELDSPGFFFRIITGNEVNEGSFKSYVQLYPGNLRYKNLCVAYAVSLFTSQESALAGFREALKRNKILGNHIAELKMLQEHGKFELNPVSGHCSFWFYDSCDFNKIECRQIITIHENS